MKHIYLKLLQIALDKEEDIEMILSINGRQVMYDGGKRIWSKVEDIDKYWNGLDIGFMQPEDFIDWMFEDV